jgi:hypothetical protein
MPETTKDAYQIKYEELCAQIAAGIHAPSQAERLSLAQSFIALLTGAYTSLGALPTGHVRDASRASIKIALGELFE